MDTVEALVRLVWLAGAAAFVLGLMRMNSPATARSGNQLSAAGMALAVGGTVVLLLVNGSVGSTGWIIILVGILIGGGVGLFTAPPVRMTGVPQPVLLFTPAG